MRLPSAVAATGLAAGALLSAAGPARAADRGTYERCAPAAGTVLLEVKRASCADAAELASQVVAAPASDERAAVAAAGWTALRARTAPRSRPVVHDLVALRGTAAVRIRRRGAAPDLDGYATGRELVYARGTIVGGRPIPRDAALCTSAFAVRLADGTSAGLSAAHCGGLRSDGTVQRRNVALRRPPQPGIVLGRVLRILTRRVALDALALPAPDAHAVVDRGVSRPPWTVAGTARPLRGRAVCFTGRTSGIDRCGRIAPARAAGAERYLFLVSGIAVRCTTIAAREGDSGGGVYTAPDRRGRVRAIGIVSLKAGPRGAMCFTPVLPVLDRLGATLLTAAG